MGEGAINTMLRPGLLLSGVIGEGSFGTVFRARQLAVGRDVAVKVLHPVFAHDTEPGRLFRDEIRAIGTIDHRNVVRIFDADDTADGRIYFVMELLSGLTLQQLADQGAISLTRAVSLVCQLLDGLAAVHAAGHIHADVKPSNIVVVGKDDRAVLIDFGLSRLRSGDQPAEAVGGTCAYMAPEQLTAWQLDARSDVFSAALVLVRLLTGWQRTNRQEVVPPLDAIEDPAIRVALERALAIEPGARPSAVDFARALRGGGADEPAAAGPPPPFRELSPLTERDRGRLFGREADIISLARRLDSGRPVVLAAPSGTGKTSLLRAGLVPYLDAAGHANVYVACEPGTAKLVCDAVCPGERTIQKALATWHAAHRRRLVVILDQIEVVIGTEECRQVLDELLDPARLPADVDLALVIGVREDFVARLLATTPWLAEGVPQVRLGPLDRAGASAAILQPLEEHGLVMEPELLDRLLEDLLRGGSEFGADLGWRSGETVYPPHLQLAGGTLLSALGPRENRLTLRHYQQLGGFDAIVGEHLERTLAQLPVDERTVARDLFLTLVTSAQIRAIRREGELFEAIGARHGDAAVRRVLWWLEKHRLVLRRIDRDGSPAWCLVHDTLIPRIENWLTVHDLDRRRTAELIRFHLRQSQPLSPATFNPRQLRAIARFPGLIEELDAEWARRPGAIWTPLSLLQRSRQAARYRRAVMGGSALALAALATLLITTLVAERRDAAAQAVLRDRDIGSFDLELTFFDLVDDPATGTAARVRVHRAELPELRWELYEPSIEDPDAPGQPTDADHVQHGDIATGPDFLEQDIRARGSAAFISVTGRGRSGEHCGPSVVPVHHIPGYARTVGSKKTIRLEIPTCQATRWGMREVPAGPFVFGGPGEPPSSLAENWLPRERVVDLPTYWIDRTEITNGAFSVFASMSEIHDVWASTYPSVLSEAAAPGYPRADIDWFDARAFCRFLGKDLPTSMQWQKALRGGLGLPDGKNPMPRRNFPYGEPITPPPIRIAPSTACADSDTSCFPVPVERDLRDRSPYGVLGLAGNLQEWVLDHEPGSERLPVSRRPRLTRGGNWADTTPDRIVDYLAAENARSPRIRTFFLGARCAASGEP